MIVCASSELKHSSCNKFKIILLRKFFFYAFGSGKQGSKNVFKFEANTDN